VHDTHLEAARPATRPQVLPEIQGERWAFNGSTVVANGRHAGRKADVWVWRVDDDQGYGTYHNVYTFFVSQVRGPVSRCAACMLGLLRVEKTELLHPSAWHFRSGTTVLGLGVILNWAVTTLGKPTAAGLVAPRVTY